MKWIEVGSRYSAPSNHKALKKVGIDIYVEKEEEDSHFKEARFLARFHDGDMVLIKQYGSLRASQKYLENKLMASVGKVDAKIRAIEQALNN
jgi:hypothetical protein